jgi:hypothetical protein
MINSTSVQFHREAQPAQIGEYPEGKNCAIPSLPPGYIPSKEPGLFADGLRQVTFTYFIAVPLALMNFIPTRFKLQKNSLFLFGNVI